MTGARKVAVRYLLFRQSARTQRIHICAAAQGEPLQLVWQSRRFGAVAGVHETRPTHD